MWTWILTVFTRIIFVTVFGKNGYSDTEIYIASVHRHEDIVKIEPDNANGRIEINISGPSYVWVRTVLSDNAFNHDDIQQIDYQSNYWNKK